MLPSWSELRSVKVQTSVVQAAVKLALGRMLPGLLEAVPMNSKSPLCVEPAVDTISLVVHSARALPTCWGLAAGFCSR